MRTPFRLLILLSLLLTPTLFAKPSLQPKKEYRVVKVQDGDTFTATDGNIKFRVRIAAMDAPEKGQPFAQMATYRLEQLLEDKPIRIDPVGAGLDRYGRTLASVSVDNSDVSLTMIREGLATYYRPSCRDYPSDKQKYNYDPRPFVEAENVARQKKSYIWSEKGFVMPCAYRRMTSTY